MALELASALLDKTGGDSLAEVHRNLDAYLAVVDRQRGEPSEATSQGDEVRGTDYVTPAADELAGGIAPQGPST